RDDPDRPGSRVDVGQRREPLHAREPVPALAPPLGVEEVVRQRSGIVLGEAEGAKARQDLVFVQDRTGSGLNVCRLASIASAISTIARAVSDSGSTATSGSPASPHSRSRESSGTWPRSGTPSSAARRAPPPAPKTS